MSSTHRHGSYRPLDPTVVAGNLRRSVRQICLRGKPSGLVARKNNLTVDDDVELAGASGLDIHWTSPVLLKPRLHTEGVGFVVSGGAVIDNDRHNIPHVRFTSRLRLSNRAAWLRLVRC